MRKKKLQFLSDKAKVKVSDVSPEEEARALSLADVALHNPTASDTTLQAGSRAKEYFRRLVEELQQEAEKVRLPNRAA